MGFSQYTVNKNDDKQFSKGLFKCGTCQKSIVFDANNRYYACLGTKGGTCSKTYIKEGVLEKDLGVFVADLQRVVRKSQAIKDLKIELRQTMTALKKDLKRLDKVLAREGKQILRVPVYESKGLRSEVAAAKELRTERTTTRRRFEEADELYYAILYLWTFAREYEEEPLFVNMYLESVVVSDKKIIAAEFSPGADYLVRLAQSDHPLKGTVQIQPSNPKISGQDITDILDQLRKLDYSTVIYKRPSRKTIERHDDLDDLQTSGELLFERDFIFETKFGSLKKEWDRIENPSEHDSAVEFAQSLENSPNLYEGGSPTRIRPEAKIKVLAHHIKELEWLLEYRPSNYQLYFEWEDQTRHLIGKMFGFRSLKHSVFLKKTSLLEFSLQSRPTRLGHFFRTADSKRKFIEALMDLLRI